MFDSSQLIVFFALGLFAIGFLTFGIGIFILAFRAANGDVKTLAQQTTRLAQKGIAEDIAGLVGNASNLVDAMNELVRSLRGVGIFLVFVGMTLMGIAAFVAMKIFEMQL